MVYENVPMHGVNFMSKKRFLILLYSNHTIDNQNETNLNDHPGSKTYLVKRDNKYLTNKMDGLMEKLLKYSFSV